MPLLKGKAAKSKKGIGEKKNLPGIDLGNQHGSRIG